MSVDLSKLDNVPAELRELPVWLLWKSKPKPGEDKPSKVPYYVDGKPRSKTDTAADRQRLVTMAQARDKYSEGFAGLGVALGRDPNSGTLLSGIDLDKCVLNDKIAPRVKEVLSAAADSYAEISPSHTGVKLFGTGDIGVEKQDALGLEIYSTGRFFTVTGDWIQGNKLTDLSPAAELARRLFEDAKHVHRSAVPKGQRNNRMTSEAGKLRARNTPTDEAWSLLQAQNRECCVPPLDERELRQIFDSVWKYHPGFMLTDLGNAERLVAAYGDDFRHIQGAGWATWDQRRWNTEHAPGRVKAMMADVVRRIYVDASTENDDVQRKNLVTHARASESRNRLEAAVALAEWQPGVADSITAYDKDPLLLGLQNGVYDLGCDTFREARRDDRLLLQANVAYDADATAPRWEQFQQEVHGGDAELVSFKQRAWGYTLSGDTSEQKMFLPYGEGANGKSTELSVILSLMGDYARKVEPETLLVRDKRGASNDIARLRGARFVATVEVEDGGRMAESLVKQLTGEDSMAARFMYQEYFEFQPVCKLWLASNHKPEVTGTDYAIWRRILLIPYLVKFEGARRDPKLKQSLLAELPGILNWMIAGYREWKRLGLASPAAVVGATKEYRDDMDRVGNFLRECCNLEPGFKTRASRVYGVYVRWMKFNGLRSVSAKKFHERMERDHKLFRVSGYSGTASDYPLRIVATEYEDIDA